MAVLKINIVLLKCIFFFSFIISITNIPRNEEINIMSLHIPVT